MRREKVEIEVVRKGTSRYMKGKAMKSHSRLSQGVSWLALLLLLGTLLLSPAMAGGVDDPITGSESTGESPPVEDDTTVPTEGDDSYEEWLLWWLTLVI
jgi:hypothetical protein